LTDVDIYESVASTDIDAKEEAMRRIGKGRTRRSTEPETSGPCGRRCDATCRAEAIRDEQFLRRSVNAPGLRVP
jgi:hypothetical protein